MAQDAHEVLSDLERYLRSPNHAPATERLAFIAETAAGPVSDQGRMQVGAAVAELVARCGGSLAYADRAGVVAQLLNRLSAHGVVVTEARR